MSLRTALILALAPLAFGASAPADAAPRQDVPSAQQARALLDAGDALAAAKAYARICKAQPDNASAHHMLGYCLHAAGELEAALKAHLAAAEFPAVRAVALYNCACVHALEGRTEPAFEFLTRAVKAGFDRPDTAREDPDLASLRGDARFAKLVAAMADGVDEHQEWTKDEKAKAKAKAKQEAAEAVARKDGSKVALGDEAVALFEEGQALLAEGEYLPAAKAFAAVTKLAPEHARAYHLLGYSLHSAGKLDAAYQAHLKAATFEETRGVALYNCACVHALKGEKAEAVALLAKSAAAGFDVAGNLPQDEDLASLRGDPLLDKVLQQVAEKRAQAEEKGAYAAGAKAASEGQEGYAAKKKASEQPGQGWTFDEPPAKDPVTAGAAPTPVEARALLDAGQPLKAAEAYAAIAAAQPDNGQAHHMVGYCLHMGGELDAAYAAHLKAAEFPAVRPTALYNAACVHALKGQPDAAFEFLSKAVEAGFSNPAQLEGDADMDPLRADPRFDVLLASLRGDAQGADAARVGPSTAAPERAFDFYLGQWTLAMDGELYGRSRVERALGGSGLRQVSLSPDGIDVRAESTYVFQPEKGRWKQVWIDREGTHVVLEGGVEGEHLVMTMVSMDGQPRVAGRSVFSNVSADGFDYRWQASEDGGRTWSEGTPVRFQRPATGAD